MRQSTPKVPARYYTRLDELLARDGFDTSALLREAGIEPDAFATPEAMLDLPRVERLLALIAERGARSDLAFDLGRALKVSAHHIVGYGMLSSADLGDALRFVARYFGLVMPTFRARYHVDAQTAELRFTPDAAMGHQCLEFHLEAIAVAAHHEIRDMSQGRLPDYRMQLSIAAPPHLARYSAMHEAACHFEAEPTPGVRLRFPASIDRHPLAMADPDARSMAEARCQTLLRNAAAAGKVSDWVTMMLREASGGVPSLRELARILNVSPRTLDRYLGAEGHRFRALANDARNAHAVRLLRDTDLSITRIAIELGYSDAANFTRAFRRANGSSPGRFRRDHAGSDGSA